MPTVAEINHTASQAREVSKAALAYASVCDAYDQVKHQDHNARTKPRLAIGDIDLVVLDKASALELLSHYKAIEHLGSDTSTLYYETHTRSPGIDQSYGTALGLALSRNLLKPQTGMMATVRTSSVQQAYAWIDTLKALDNSTQAWIEAVIFDSAPEVDQWWAAIPPCTTPGTRQPLPPFTMEYMLDWTDRTPRSTAQT